LRNYAYHLWAADLLTVPIVTFKTLYVLVHRAWPSRASPRQRNSQPDGCLDLASADRGHALGHKRARRMGIDAIAAPIHARKGQRGRPSNE
jgi:hypothetical protein